MTRCYPHRSSEPWLLSVGALQAQCGAAGAEDTATRLAVSRGLLTCCPPRILLSPRAGGTEVSGMGVKQC